MKTPINFKNKNMIEIEAPCRNLKPSWRRRRFPRGGGGREGGREGGRALAGRGEECWTKVKWMTLFFSRFLLKKH
jgi:hypothetical protein